MKSEYVTRSFVGDIADSHGKIAEISVTFDQWEYTNGEVEPGNEHFELGGEFVTYTDLVRRFGKRNTDSFIERATENAR